MAANVVAGRYSAQLDEPRVVFLIGMRINRLRSVRRWAPVMAAMPRMLRELEQHPELGLLDARSYLSGRTLLVVQYWASIEQLYAFATDRDRTHLPAWQAFNRRAAATPDVGIFHETYPVDPDAVENIYGDMPRFGLALAGRHVPTDTVGRTARRRMRRSGPDTPAVV